MALTTEEIREVAATFTRKAYQEDGAEPLVGTQAQRAAAQVLDNLIQSSQTAINTALPEPFKSTASLQEKTLMFVLVAQKRAGLI